MPIDTRWPCGCQAPLSAGANVSSTLRSPGSRPQISVPSPSGAQNWNLDSSDRGGAPRWGTYLAHDPRASRPFVPRPCGYTRGHEQWGTRTSESAWMYVSIGIHLLSASRIFLHHLQMANRRSERPGFGELFTGTMIVFDSCSCGRGPDVINETATSYIMYKI